MKIGVSIKIDVTKIDKSRLFKGEKGTYLDLTTFIDASTEDQYGNHGFISQSVTKEERDNGVKTDILGNCKVFYNDQQSNNAPRQAPAQQAQRSAPQQNAASMDDFDDSIPFANPYKGIELII